MSVTAMGTNRESSIGMANSTPALLPESGVDPEGLKPGPESVGVLPELGLEGVLAVPAGADVLAVPAGADVLPGPDGEDVELATHGACV
jgi:hypothetical protein